MNKKEVKKYPFETEITHYVLKGKKKKISKILINLASLLFLSSVIMDSYLWITQGFHVPSWTIALMSLGYIMLLQYIKKN